MNGYENIAAPAIGKDDEIVEAVEELVREYGMKCFVAGVAKSSASDASEGIGRSATLRCISWILREIVHSENPRLTAEVMAIGAGVIVSDDATMTRVAKKWGLSKAAISKRVVKFCEEWNLPPSAYMRKEADRKTYALTNRPKL